MKVSLVLNRGLYAKTGMWVLSRKRHNVSNSGYNQDMFENGKPNIVLKTAKNFNIKRTAIKILI